MPNFHVIKDSTNDNVQKKGKKCSSQSYKAKVTFYLLWLKQLNVTIKMRNTMDNITAFFGNFNKYWKLI